MAVEIPASVHTGISPTLFLHAAVCTVTTSNIDSLFAGFLPQGIVALLCCLEEGTLSGHEILALFDTCDITGINTC